MTGTAAEEDGTLIVSGTATAADGTTAAGTLTFDPMICS
jgi:hypothetical protein